MAYRLGWQRADLDELMESTYEASFTRFDTAAAPLLREMEALVEDICSIIGELQVFITTIERTVEMVVENKVRERVNSLDHEDLLIEADAALLLHEWMRTKEEVAGFKSEVSSLSTYLTDVIIERALVEAAPFVGDKDMGHGPSAGRGRQKTGHPPKGAARRRAR